MAWSALSLVPGVNIVAGAHNIGQNLKNGYQFGDITRGLFGVTDDPAPSSARASELDSMSEREFADYQMREAHMLGVEADATKYQRAYEDIKKAGLNPRLLLQSGADTGSPTASSGYSYSQSKSESSSKTFSTSALAVGMLALAIKLLK